MEETWGKPEQSPAGVAQWLSTGWRSAWRSGSPVEGVQGAANQWFSLTVDVSISPSPSRSETNKNIFTQQHENKSRPCPSPACHAWNDPDLDHLQRLGQWVSQGSFLDLENLQEKTCWGGERNYFLRLPPLGAEVTQGCVWRWMGWWCVGGKNRLIKFPGWEIIHRVCWIQAVKVHTTNTVFSSQSKL